MLLFFLLACEVLIRYRLAGWEARPMHEIVAILVSMVLAARRCCSRHWANW